MGRDRRDEERVLLMEEEREQAEDLPHDEESPKSSLVGHEKEDEDWYSWLTTQEAAALSGYDIQHVRRLARQGKIGAVKRGQDLPRAQALYPHLHKGCILSAGCPIPVIHPRLM